MRVLYVISSLTVGGAESLLVAQMPFLLRLGVEPIVVTAGPPFTLLPQLPAGVPHVCLDVGVARGPLSGLALSVRIARRLRRVVLRHSPDLVHLNLYQSDAWGRLGVGRRAKTVTTWHSLDPWMADRSLNGRIRVALERWTLRKRRAWVLAVSRMARDWGCRHLHASPKRVEVIYNGIDVSRYPGRPPARSNGKPRIVMVGRFFPEKGHDVALRALRVLREANIEFAVDFLGDGPRRQEMMSLAREWGLADVTGFPGFCLDIPRALPTYDVLIMPSRFEGFGIAAVEAMASFVPVAAARVPGLAEIIEDGVNGLLVPADDPGALAGAIQRLLGDAALSERLVQNGRRKVEQEFRLDVQVSKMVAYYRRILDMA